MKTAPNTIYEDGMPGVPHNSDGCWKKTHDRVHNQLGANACEPWRKNMREKMPGRHIVDPSSRTVKPPANHPRAITLEEKKEALRTGKMPTSTKYEFVPKSQRTKTPARKNDSDSANIAAGETGDDGNWDAPIAAPEYPTQSLPHDALHAQIDKLTNALNAHTEKVDNRFAEQNKTIEELRDQSGIDGYDSPTADDKYGDEEAGME